MSASGQRPASAAATQSAMGASVESVVWRVVDFLAEVSPRRDEGLLFLGDLEFDSLKLVTMYAICEELFGVELLDSDDVVEQVAVAQLIEFLSTLVDKGVGHLPDDGTVDALLEEYA